MANFLTDDEKLQLMSSRSGCTIRHYPNSFVQKVYRGLELLFYHYSNEKQLMYDTVLFCTNIICTEKVLEIVLVDRRTYEIVTITHNPRYFLAGNHVDFIDDLVMYSPFSCNYEYTMKETRNQDVHEGIAFRLGFLTRSDPKLKVPFHSQVIPLHLAERIFGKEEARQAESNAAEGVHHA